MSDPRSETTPSPAGDRLAEQLLETWRIHDEIHRELLHAIPEGGLMAIPAESRGRTVAEQFFHTNRVRLGWVGYHRTGKRPKLPRAKKGEPIPRGELDAALRESGQAVERHLTSCFAGEARIRMFGGSPVRWLGYLISHESHHRGSILLALKQNGMRQPEKVAIQGVWGTWR